jgi:excisionase family DNA binding protein
MMTSKPLSVREAADRAGVSEALVRAWVKSGDLPHYRLGRRPGRGKIAVALADLDAFLATRRVEAPPPVPEAATRARGGDGDFPAYYQRFMAAAGRKRLRRP